MIQVPAIIMGRSPTLHSSGPPAAAAYFFVSPQGSGVRIMMIRRISRSDLLDITRIQDECYSDHFVESKASFSAKLSAHSELSFVALQDGLVVGYVFALPWVYGGVPTLNGLEYSIPPNADSLYIHDIAVSRVARKAGLAERLLNSVLDAANQKGCRRVFLVAVQGASSYWRRHGFEDVYVSSELRQCLASYGEGATYMARPVVA